MLKTHPLGPVSTPVLKGRITMNDPQIEAAVREAERQFYHALRRIGEDGADPLLAAWSHGDDVTTLNAAGGYEQGWEGVRGRWTWWAAQGRPMRATKVEHLAFVAAAELAYTVALEHHDARVLRVTHVYRHQDGTWKMVHRHADPLVAKGG